MGDVINIETFINLDDKIFLDRIINLTDIDYDKLIIHKEIREKLNIFFNIYVETPNNFNECIEEGYKKYLERNSKSDVIEKDVLLNSNLFKKAIFMIYNIVYRISLSI